MKEFGPRASARPVAPWIRHWTTFVLFVVSTKLFIYFSRKVGLKVGHLINI